MTTRLADAASRWARTRPDPRFVTGAPAVRRGGGGALAAVLGLAVAAGALGLPSSAEAQGPGESLRIAGPDSSSRSLAITEDRGYAALPAFALAPHGWELLEPGGGEGDDGRTWTLRHGSAGTEIGFEPGVPFFRWNGELLHLVSEPYLERGTLYLPLQLVRDFFPARLGPAWMSADGGEGMRVADPEHWPAAARTGPGAQRVVVIDAGHGGRDLGAIGPGGVSEKDIALGVARALAEELGRYPGIEVHMTRDEDVFIPLWERGSWATERKGGRHGVFLSLHADALPSSRSTRGFSTYFLSDARTEHERRVAANENAPLRLENGEEGGADAQGDLDFILKELRNLDHQHWSGLLAELVQARVAPVHPGPDHGVKQGPFAVITNALMPAVLIETGFISNRDDERILASGDFQRELARGIAEAVVDFFERYPPGQGVELEEGRDPA